MALATAPASAPTFGTAAQRRWVVPVAVFAALVVIAVAVDPDVPGWLDLGVQKWVRDRYMWTIENRNTHWLFTGVFNPLADAIDWCVREVQWVLRTLRYPGVLALVGTIGWMTGGIRAACSGLAAMAAVAVLGVWDPAMVTLSIMLTAVLIALLIGCRSASGRPAPTGPSSSCARCSTSPR
jgi:glycine betaine/proline transport system permease protein